MTKAVLSISSAYVGKAARLANALNSIAAASYDAVYCQGVLSHADVDELPVVFAAMRHVLNADGFVELIWHGGDDRDAIVRALGSHFPIVKAMMRGPDLRVLAFMSPQHELARY